MELHEIRMLTIVALALVVIVAVAVAVFARFVQRAGVASETRPMNAPRTLSGLEVRGDDAATILRTRQAAWRLRC